MANWKKTLEQVLAGDSDANIRYDDLCHLLERLNFTKRQTGGSHCLFKKPGMELINLQRAADGKAYQVRQVREILKKSSP